MNRRVLNHVLSAVMFLSFLNSSWADSICSNLSFTVQLGVLDSQGISQITNELTVTAGVPVAVKITAKNIGHTPLTINLNNFQLTNKRNGFVIEILESGNRIDSPVLLPQGPEMDHPVTLQPGEGKEGSIVLTSYFPDLTRSGRFAVRVSYNWDWAVFILTKDGSKHPYEICHCESEAVYLNVVAEKAAKASTSHLETIEDGDYGAHFVYALVNSSANGAIVPTAEDMSKWKGSYAQMYVDTLYVRYPKKADLVMQAVLRDASTNSLLKLRQSLGKHKEAAKYFAPPN